MKRIGLLLALGIGLGATPGLRTTWAQEGQPDLDKATRLKINATTLQQLSEVASLCETAIKKGLDAENEGFARKLLSASLFQRVVQMCQPIFDAPRPDSRWRLLRGVAMRDLDKIVEYDPEFGEAHLMIGKLQALPDGDRKRARQALEQAIESFAKNKKKLSEAYLYRGQLQESPEQRLADYGRAVELDPENTSAWQARAVYYLSQGKSKEAIADFNKLLEKDQGNMSARLAVAEALMNVKEYEEALKRINETIDKQPTAIALTLRAQLWAMRNEFDKAITDLDEALKLEPGDLGLLLMRARLYAIEGRHALALDDVNRILQARPDLQQAIEIRATVQASLGKFKEAIADMRQLLQRDPDSVPLQLQLAIYLNAAEKSREAIKLYSDILAHDAKDAAALRGRGDAYLNVGQHAKAVADYELAIQAEPDDSGTLNNFAWVLATSPDDGVRDGQRAIKLATKACELTEYQQAHILSTLAAAYAETGDFETAKKWSRKAVELGDASVKDQLKQELESYRQKKPWRERKEEADAKETEEN